MGAWAWLLVTAGARAALWGHAGMAVTGANAAGHVGATDTGVMWGTHSVGAVVGAAVGLEVAVMPWGCPGTPGGSVLTGGERHERLQGPPAHHADHHGREDGDGVAGHVHDEQVHGDLLQRRQRHVPAALRERGHGCAGHPHRGPRRPGRGGNTSHRAPGCLRQGLTPHRGPRPPSP